MPCSQDECPSEAHWQPVIETRWRRGEKPERCALLQLGYCDGHKTTSSLATVLSDEGFTKISKFLREAGRPSPDRSLTTLGWNELDPFEAAELAERQHHTQSPEEELAF